MQVSLSHRAAAFRAGSTTYYALFEEAYPFNQPNPRPSVRCVAFGTYAQALHWVFAAAVNCETGMTRGPDGALSAETWLSLWREAFARPDRMFTQPIFLEASHGAHSTIPTHSETWYQGNMLPGAIAKLKAQGYASVAGRLLAGDTVILELHRDAAVVADIFGYAGKYLTYVAPSRVIRPHANGEGETSLAPVSAASARCSAPLDLRLLDLGFPARVLRVGPNTSIVGDRDAMFSQFATTVALRCERDCRNGGTSALSAFRDVMVAPAASVEPGCALCVDLAAAKRGALHRETLRKVSHVLAASTLSLSGNRALFDIDRAKSAGVLGALLSLPGAALGFAPAADMRAFLDANALRPERAA